MKNEKIGKIELDLSLYDPYLVYSDGEIEDELLEISEKCSIRQIDEMLQKSDNWPFFYHFSKIRENILNWYPFDPKSNVLEVGAGCGAITGLLCRKCKEVTALDLSLKRSEINAYRHSKCENLKIVVSNIEKYVRHCKKKYDYIVMIGVFEYVGSYMDNDDPYGYTLNLLNGLLKSNGKLLIAIENRFGAKYFAGVSEDHLGTYYSSVEGYDNNRVRTFNLKEWRNLLKINGFDEYRTYFPYPDYKFPLVVYSDDLLPDKHDLKRNYINLERERYMVFNEEKFYDSLTGTDYFRDFSNSFLFEIKGRKI